MSFEPLAYPGTAPAEAGACFRRGDVIKVTVNGRIQSMIWEGGTTYR